MAYKATVKVSAKCPVHPRFSPERGGRGAVVGGCRFCDALCDVQQAIAKAQVLVRALQDQR